MRFSVLIFSYATLLIIFGISLHIIAGKDVEITFAPIVFGGIIFIMGIMSVKKDFTLFGQHAATALSVIAFISSVSVFLKIFNSEPDLFYTHLADIYVAILSLIFLLCAVRQFGIDRKENSGKITDKGEI